MIRVFLGFLILLGVAGNDCDGHCAPTMAISEMIFWSLIGLALVVWGLPKVIDQDLAR